MVHRYIRDSGHELTIHVNFMVKYVCYIGLRSNCCFVINSALTGNYYRTYIISSVGHLRSNSVGLLVLWTVAYNIWGTSIVLQVPRDNVNPSKNE